MGTDSPQPFASCDSIYYFESTLLPCRQRTRGSDFDTWEATGRSSATPDLIWEGWIIRGVLLDMANAVHQACSFNGDDMPTYKKFSISID